MARITTDEFDLLGFFEVEPVLRDPKAGWLETVSTYEISRNGITACFSVHPSYRDVKIKVSKEGVAIYELSSMGVGNVSVTTNENMQYLTVLLEGEHSIDLYLKPDIHVKQYIEVTT